jgi:hypothetical protein
MSVKANWVYPCFQNLPYGISNLIPFVVFVCNKEFIGHNGGEFAI